MGAWHFSKTLDIPVAAEVRLKPGIDHRLRNVLTVISANIDLIERAVDDDILRRRIAIIREAIKSCLEILDSVASRHDVRPK